MNSTQIDYKRLKAAVQKSGLRTGYIAQQVGISPRSLRDTLRGARAAKIPEIKLLCQTLKINENEVYKKAA